MPASDHASPTPAHPPDADASLADPHSRRREILCQATALFLAHGYAGTSMSALAAACGVQKATLYHHFPSKEALFVACVTDGYDDILGELRRIRDDATLADDERFRRALDAVYRLNIDSVCGRMSPLVAEVSLRIPEVARAFHDQFIQPQHDVMDEILDAGVARGAFVPHDRLGVEHLIFGPVVSLTLSREMFASFEALDMMLPVDQVRSSHGALILALLQPGRTPGTRTNPAPPTAPTRPRKRVRS